MRPDRPSKPTVSDTTLSTKMGARAEAVIPPRARGSRKASRAAAWLVVVVVVVASCRDALSPRAHVHTASCANCRYHEEEGEEDGKGDEEEAEEAEEAAEEDTVVDVDAEEAVDDAVSVVGIIAGTKPSAPSASTVWSSHPPAPTSAQSLPVPTPWELATLAHRPYAVLPIMTTNTRSDVEGRAPRDAATRSMASSSVMATDVEILRRSAAQMAVGRGSGFLRWAV
jgi:hypothetical protein